MKKSNYTLPEKIKMGLVGNKPDTQLKFVGKINGKETIRYVGIKTGGIVFETKGNTKEDAIYLMKKQINKYGQEIFIKKIKLKGGGKL